MMALFLRTPFERLLSLRFAIIVGTLALALSATPAGAHPLGNFTINHLTKIAVARDHVSLRYVLDMAEIPTFSALRAASSSGTLAKPQLESWGRTEAASLLPELLLSGDAGALPLRLDRVTTRTRPGAGGLPTLYLVLDAHALLPHTDARITYRDETFPGRLGWHDVVVAPRTEPTQELSAYPSALIGSPRATTAVSLTLRNGAVASVQTDDTTDESGAAAAVPSAVRSNQLSDMLARGTSDWGFVALTFLVAIVLGGLHALEPGHGKTLLAVSLVGARATVKQAAILAAALTVAHTIGVLALGVAINLFKGYFVPETIYPWITLVSGIVIAVIGARAVQRQILLRQPLAHGHAHEHAETHPHEHTHVHSTEHDEAGHAHGHSHGSHSHSHDGRDDIAHARSHAVPGNAPLTFGGTVWAAMSGGVAPCPAALVVLLAALALNQVAYGIFVIIAFSLGLAVTLTGLGIAVVRGASWLQDRPQFERFVVYGPLVSAIVISTIGSIMVGQGFAQQGVSISPLAITAIVALAIVGFAFSHPFSHRHAEAA
jgi:nickel/cobalt exporter